MTKVITWKQKCSHCGVFFLTKYKARKNCDDCREKYQRIRKPTEN